MTGADLDPDALAAAVDLAAAHHRAGVAEGQAEPVSLAAAAHEAVPVERSLQDGLDPAIEARLAQEVDRLVAAFVEFGRGTQAISVDAAAGNDFDKLVPLSFALAGFQLANAFARRTQGLGLLCGDPKYLEQVCLRLNDFFRELDLDGRRFVAIALADQREPQILGGGERGND